MMFLTFIQQNIAPTRFPVVFFFFFTIQEADLFSRTLREILLFRWKKWDKFKILVEIITKIVKFVKFL